STPLLAATRSAMRSGCRSRTTRSAPRRSARGRSCTRSTSAATGTGSRPTCPPASSGAWSLVARSRCGRSWCCSTSRPPAPTPELVEASPAIPEPVITTTMPAAPQLPRTDPVEVARATGTLLEVDGLAAGYGHLEVIRDINLTVQAGEVVACIGANGAGKTTTLRAISGVIRPRAGRVTFGGHDITGARPERISRLGLAHIPEGRGLFPRLSVEDTLRLAV